MDCAHVILSSTDTQWRVLVEQRSTGYVWSGEGCTAEANFMPCLETAPEEGQTRRRLSGLKQMSVEKIANIRQRLAEGRRLLRTRSESEDLARYIFCLLCVLLEPLMSGIHSITVFSPDLGWAAQSASQDRFGQLLLASASSSSSSSSSSLSSSSSS